MPHCVATFDENIPPWQRGRREATVVAKRQGVVRSAFPPHQDNPLKAPRPREIFSPFLKWDSQRRKA